MVRADKGKLRKIWGFDSEFLTSGRAGHPEDVQTVQFSDGERSWVLESPEDLKKWIVNHRKIHTIYGFVCLPDLGSLWEWLGAKHVQIKRRGIQTTGWIKYAGANIYAVDARPLLAGFGLRRLADCGAMIGVPKRLKPDWLGIRKWQSESEYKEFIEYAKADAIITSRIVKWLIDNYNADPRKYISAGTLAGHYFHFPRRLKVVKEDGYGKPRLSLIERWIKNYTFAGRSEGFITGYTPNVIYNDVASLYPCSIVATRAMQISGVKPCEFKELTVDSDLSETRYGWVDGTFRSDNDLWGLPVRGERNYFMTGELSGIYSTFDLAAAKGELLHVKQCYKPIMRDDPTEHNKYADMLMRKLEGKYNPKEKGYYKAILNATSGKLGQSHPISEKSNFLAYNILLGHSHLIMSKLFDKCKADVIAMDTDSIFSQHDMSGTWFECSDGERNIPIRMDVKGRGDLAFFRSKRYIMQGEKPCYGRHGWRYFLADYLKLFNGDLTELDTRKDVKATLFTHEKAALKMTKGRWRTRPEHLDLERIKHLLRADMKRKRTDYDSYSLVMQKKNIRSQAWNFNKYMSTAEYDILGIIPE